jgi:hypothetical protein
MTRKGWAMTRNRRVMTRKGWAMTLKERRDDVGAVPRQSVRRPFDFLLLPGRAAAVMTGEKILDQFRLQRLTQQEALDFAATQLTQLVKLSLRFNTSATTSKPRSVHIRIIASRITRVPRSELWV